MIGDSVAFLAAADHGPEVVYDAEHFFDGYAPEPRLRAADHPRRRRGRGPLDRPLRHQRRDPPRAGRRGRRPPSARPSRRAGRHPHPQRRRAGRRQHPGGDPLRRRPGPGHDQRHRRALRQRRPLQRDRQPRPEVRGLRAAEAREPGAPDRGLALRLRAGQPELPHRPALRRRRAPSPTRAGCTSTASARSSSSYEHIDPGLVGNERRVLVSELSGRSNIAEKLAEHGLEHDNALMARVLDRVVRTWRTRATSSRPPRRRFVLLVEKEAGRYRRWFERLHYHVSVEARDGGVADHRGDRQAPDRRRRRAHRQRGRRPGQRPRRRPPQGARAPLPPAPRDEPGRLQGPRHQRPRRHRRPRPRRHREPRRPTTSGAPSASPRTSSRRAGWPWSTPSSTSSRRTPGAGRSAAAQARDESRDRRLLDPRRAEDTPMDAENSCCSAPTGSGSSTASAGVPERHAGRPRRPEAPGRRQPTCRAPQEPMTEAERDRWRADSRSVGLSM